MNEYRKSFEQLVKENAPCAEFGWHGYIRLYEKGEKRCECKDCILLKTLGENCDS